MSNFSLFTVFKLYRILASALICPVEHNSSYTRLISKAAHGNHAAEVSVSFHRLQREPAQLSQRRNINPGAICHMQDRSQPCATCKGTQADERPSYVLHPSPLFFNTSTCLSHEPCPWEHSPLETAMFIH